MRRQNTVKGKKPTCALLVAILVVLVLSMATVSVGAGQPKVFVDPSTCTATLLGEVFTIDINIVNVTGLCIIEFKLGYNTTLLDALDAVVGPFPEPPVITNITIHEPEGYVNVSVQCWPTWGNGTLATVTFNATYAESASCTLHLYDTVLENLHGNPIPHDVEDGNYNFAVLTLTVATDKTTYQLGENVEIHGNLTSPYQGLVAIEVDDPTGFKKKVTRTLQIGATPPPGDITIVDVYPCDMWGTPQENFTRETDAYFNMTVRNDGTESKNVTMTINAYDGNIVPLPSVPTFTGLMGPNTQQQFIAPINIPNWTCIGTGMVYANAFTNLPRAGGVPYCPEKSATFNITGSGGGGAGAPETQGSGNNSTAGNYSLTFKLPPDAKAGVYRVYAGALARSLYQEWYVTDSTLFGVNVIVVPEHFSSIQKAVNATSPTNKTVLVLPETYNEHITINKSLTLVGIDPSNTIINGSGIGTVVTVTADNVEISGFTIQNSGSSSYSGIYLNNSSGSTISQNIILGNHNGIYLNNSSQENTIQDNNITSSNNYGIYLNHSTGTTLRVNDMICNKYNLGIFGDSILDFIHDIDNSTTVDGKPIIYWKNQQNKTVPSDAGFIAIVNSTNITVRELNLTKNGQGVLFAFTTNSLIEGLNTASNEYGIYLVHSHNNTIVGSTVSNNTVGIYQSYSNQNVVCHNNFTNNADQVLSEESVNTWDAGYPSGGNYWSHFIGNDTYSGPYQNETGSDEIVDTPYVIDANNTDRYPFMNPWISVHDIAITNVTRLPDVTQVYTGQVITITATIKNEGDFTETNLTITAYYDGNPVEETKTMPKLAPQRETAINFTWNTTGVSDGNYTITANATIVPGETDTADNTYPDGWVVVVTIFGDVNRDGVVNIIDIILCCINMGPVPPRPPECDLNEDGTVNILDIILCCINMG